MYNLCTVTENEKSLLHDIATSEYQDSDGIYVVGVPIWTDVIVDDSKSRAATLGSLLKKGLVTLTEENKKSDNTVALTLDGYYALNNIVKVSK